MVSIIYESNKQIVSEIKRIMLETKSTYKSVSDQLDINPQSLTKIFNKKNFSFDDAAKILSTMGYDLIIDFRNRTEEYIPLPWEEHV